MANARPGLCSSLGWSEFSQRLYITGTLLVAIMVPIGHLFYFNGLREPKWKIILDFGCIFRGFLLKTIEIHLLLAARTIVSPPPSHQNAPDRRLATVARKPRALVDAMFQLEKTAHSFGIHVIAHR